MPDRNHDLVRVSYAFRRAFETVDLRDAPGSLPHFPSGCCSWATWMVGHYLKFELGCLPFSVEAERQGPDDYDTHAWLDVDGFTIDLTADQYLDSPSAVIATPSSAWHKMWQVNRRSPIEPIQRYDELDRTVNPSDIYQRVAKIVRGCKG